MIDFKHYIMKSHKFFLSVIVLIAGFNSCVDLDREIIIGLTEDQVYESFDYNERRVNSIYNTLPLGFAYIDDAMLACASDEAEFTMQTSDVQNFNTGSWDAINNADDVWNTYYHAIYNINSFLETVDLINLDAYKFDPSTSAQQTYLLKLEEIERWKDEVTFLRAFFYFELIKRYGGVPLITNTLSIDDDFENIARASLDECIQFISDECDVAASGLPKSYSTSDLGRATKGAALALKSRVLLYAASDLFNDPSWADGYQNTELIASSNISTTARKTRWEDAANAAKAVIDLGKYSLESSYGELFLDFNNSEIIFDSREGSSNYFEKLSYPIGYDNGNSGTTPSQNLVDAYEMLDGSDFDWNNSEHSSSPYENRDPRLKYSILTNNTEFNGRPVECWTGGRDGKGTDGATRTGYYLLKYVNPDLDLTQDYTSVHSWILFRLAEIYLNYAEALNEYDPGNNNIEYYINAVRNRDDVNMPDIPQGLSQNEMREIIQHERRIELAFEGHRFWDLRRWMLAPDYLGNILQGVEITKTGENKFTYKKIDVEPRTWASKMYFYPIPQSEILKTGWEQNPLW